MNTIVTVLRKELLSTFRDKKTLFSAILLPALAMPLLLVGVTKLQVSLTEKERAKELKVVLHEAPPGLQEQFEAAAFKVMPPISLDAARDSLEKEKYDAVLAFHTDFVEQVAGTGSGRVVFYHRSTQEVVQKRVMGVMDAYEAELLEQRLQRLGLQHETIDPVAVEVVDMATTKEQIGQVIGGFLPYLFIIFCFTGCMYPALDIVTGEKEKGTMETLLTTPASRFMILLGKMFAIALIGIVAALMAILSLYATVRIATEIPPAFADAMNDILSVRFIVMLFAMLLPLSLFFAALISAVAIRASSFKEAQSYVTPLMFVVIVPAMIALMPGMKLSWTLALVPILNIALATKEIIADTIDPVMYAAIIVSLVLLALASVVVSKGQFDKEGNILK